MGYETNTNTFNKKLKVNIFKGKKKGFLALSIAITLFFVAIFIILAFVGTLYIFLLSFSLLIVFLAFASLYLIYDYYFTAIYISFYNDKIKVFYKKKKKNKIIKNVKSIYFNSSILGRICIVYNKNGKEESVIYDWPIFVKTKIVCEWIKNNSECKYDIPLLR